MRGRTRNLPEPATDLQRDLVFADFRALQQQPDEFLALVWLQGLVDLGDVRERRPDRLC